MRRVLLSAGEAPADARPFGGAKLKALVSAGFLEAARSIESPPPAQIPIRRASRRWRARTS
ncbi:MAG: hypothetical protein R3C42_03365 [Parvularculaceae bacterium]